jgi:hypothetical protein
MASPAHVVHLHTQLPRRHHNNRKRARQRCNTIPSRISSLSERPLHHRNGVCQRFTAAGLGTTEDVQTITHGAGDDGGLDGQGRGKALGEAGTVRLWWMTHTRILRAVSETAQLQATCHVVNSGGDAAVEHDSSPTTPGHRVRVGARGQSGGCCEG